MKDIEKLSSADVRDIPVGQLEPNPWQPRKSMDKEDLQKLVDSIKAVGIIQPITARKLVDKRFQVACGHRRLEAVKRLRLPSIPVLVRDLDDKQMRIFAIAENLTNKNLLEKDKEAAVHELWETFYSKLPISPKRRGGRPGVVEMAKDLGEDPATISRLLTAFEADKDLGCGPQRKMSSSDMVDIAAVLKTDRDAAKKLAKAVENGDLGSRELHTILPKIQDAPDAASRSDVIERVLEAKEDAKHLTDFAIEDADVTKIEVRKGADQRAVERAVSVLNSAKTAFVSQDLVHLSTGAANRIIEISELLSDHLTAFRSEAEQP